MGGMDGRDGGTEQGDGAMGGRLYGRRGEFAGDLQENREGEGGGGREGGEGWRRRGKGGRGATAWRTREGREGGERGERGERSGEERGQTDRERSGRGAGRKGGGEVEMEDGEKIESVEEQMVTHLCFQEGITLPPSRI